MINALTIIGRVTRTPELKKSVTGKSVIALRIANDLGKDHTVFINVRAYDHIAENLAKYATKGKMIAVSGNIDSWDDNEKRTHYFIKAQNVQILTQNKSEAESTSNEPVEENGDELPW